MGETGGTKDYLQVVKKEEGNLSNLDYLNYVLKSFADRAGMPNAEFNDIRAIAKGRIDSTFMIDDLLDEMYKIEEITQGKIKLLIPLMADPDLEPSGEGFRKVREVNGKKGVVIRWGLDMGDTIYNMATVSPLIRENMSGKLKVVPSELTIWKLERIPPRRNFRSIEGGKK